MPSTHTPAFKQGFDRHSLMPSLHWIPVQPGAHTHLHVVPTRRHVPNEQGPLSHGERTVSQSLPTRNHSLFEKFIVNHFLVLTSMTSLTCTSEIIICSILHGLA